MKTVTSDLTIIGGGIAGVCAAIAAARLGIKVSLINDRPVLGGNSSSEFRVWISGAQTGWNRYARESGIIEELLMKNHYVNPEGNPHIWDSIILDTVTQEPNIDVYLNTYINDVTMSTSKITAVKGFQMRTHEEIEFVSPLYLDSTGDGAVAFLAGASFLLGRESKEQFGESLAPDVADQYTMGNTLFFYTKDVGRPVTFHRPAFAAPPEELEFLKDRFRGPYISERASGCDCWWFEYGGTLDTIHEDPLITTKIQSLVWGIWDYIKNSGKFDADNLTLEWIGSLPGKRESRRFIGDYILTQDDVQSGRHFPDAVGFGGWPIDIHPPEGICSNEPPCHQIPVGIYDIPYRTLYSKDVDNLFLAGRNHSASRIAFSSTRVMATCGVMGQAVGTAAYLAIHYNRSPREIGQIHIHELQQLLLKNDVYIRGVKADDSNNLARTANVTASSERVIINEISDGQVRLDTDYCLVLPVSEQLNHLDLLITAEQNTQLHIQIYDTGRPESYNPAKLLQQQMISIHEGDLRWYRIPVAMKAPRCGKLFFMLRSNDAVSVGTSTSELTGVLTLKKSTNKEQPPGVLAVPYILANTNLCFRTDPQQKFTAESVINGYARPYGGANMWSSTVIKDEPQVLRFKWEKPQLVKEVRITFNTDLNKRFINLKAVDTNVFPQTVKDYDIIARLGDKDVTVCSVQGNYQRFNVHQFAPVETDEVQIVIHNTNGGLYAEVFDVKIY